MARVSVIIPTLNRAHLLRTALKSVVEQDFEDLEIVVCDDFSEDNTKEVADSFGTEKIVYVRTEKRLNMSDTFEFALSKSTGEYVTFLTDACYLLPNCISTAIKELEKFDVKLAMWRHCGYFGPDWMEARRRNTLQIPKVTFKTYLLDSRDALEKFYDNIREPVIPKSINSLCHRSIVEKIIKVQRRFFLPPIPDHSSAASVLINTQKFVFVDKPLFIGGISSANIGASQSFNLGKSAQNFLKGFEGKTMEEIAFLGIYTTASLIVKSLENVRNFYPNNCPEININNALFEITDSLSKLEVYGTDVKEYWKKLKEYIEEKDGKLRLLISLKRIKSKLKWSLVKIIRSLPYLYRFETLRNMYILEGRKLKFNSIAECARLVEKFNNRKRLN